MIAPATQELSQLVHDPSVIFKAGMLDPKNIETGNDGKPVVVDGYERISFPQWVERNVQPYMQITAKPQGSGAPAGRASDGNVRFDEQLMGQQFLMATAVQESTSLLFMRLKRNTAETLELRIPPRPLVVYKGGSIRSKAKPC